MDGHLSSNITVMNNTAMNIPWLKNGYKFFDTLPMKRFGLFPLFLNLD